MPGKHAAIMLASACTDEWESTYMTTYKGCTAATQQVSNTLNLAT